MTEQKNKALRSIFKGGVIIFIGTIASKAMGLIYRILVGSQLGPTDYGVISVMMAVFSAASAIANLGIPAGAQKFVAQYRGKNSEAKIHGSIKSSMNILLLSTFIVGIFLIIFAPMIARFLGEPKALWPIRLIGFAIPFLGFTQLFMNVWEAYEEMKYTVYTLQLGNNIIKIVLAAILVGLGFGYLGAALAFSLAFIGSGILAYYFYREVIPEKVLNATPEYNYSELLNHSWPLLTASFFAIITGNIDTFMIQKFIGTTATGLYNAAYPFAILLTALSSVFGSIFLSNSSKLIGEGKKSEIADLNRTVVKWTSVFTFPVFLIIFAFPKFVLLIFGNQYTGLEVQNTLRILSVGFMFGGLVGPSGNIYQAFDRTKLNFIASFILASANFIGNYFLIKELGVIGAAIASTIGYTLILIFNFYFVRKLTGKNPIRSSTIKVLLSSIIAISLTYLAVNFFFTITPLWVFPFAMCFYLLSYVFLLVALRSLDEEDLVIIDAIEEKTGLENKFINKLLRAAT